MRTHTRACISGRRRRRDDLAMSGACVCVYSSGGDLSTMFGPLFCGSVRYFSLQVHGSEACCVRACLLSICG